MGEELVHSQKHKQVVGNHFGAIASHYDAEFDSPLGVYVWTVMEAALAEMLPSQIEGVAVDVGTGTGMSLKLLFQRGARSIGIDLSWQMLEIAWRKMCDEPLVSLVQADAECLPFRKSVIDLVLGVTVLEFVPNPRTCLFRIRKVLRSAGQLVLVVLSSMSVWAVESYLRNLAQPESFKYTRFFSPWQVIRMLRQVDFVKIRYHGAVYAPMITPTAVLRGFSDLDSKWGRRWLLRSFGALLVFYAQHAKILTIKKE